MGRNQDPPTNGFYNGTTKDIEKQDGEIIWWTCIKVHLNHPSIVYSFDLPHDLNLNILFDMCVIFTMHSMCTFSKCKLNDIFGVMMAKLCEVASSTKNKGAICCNHLEVFQ